MIDNFLEKLTSTKSHIQMDVSRKSEIRQVLLAQIEMTNRRNERAASRGWFFYVLRTALTVFLVASLGAGTSFASERSFPGDTLYPVKIGVVEPVRAFVAIGEEAKALWDVERATRRLEEIEAVEENPFFTDSDLRKETIAGLERGFAERASDVRQRLEDIQIDNPVLAADIVSRFEISLLARQKKKLIRTEEEKENTARGLPRTDTAAKRNPVAPAFLSTEDDTLRTDAFPGAPGLAIKVEEQKIFPKNILSEEIGRLQKIRESIEEEPEVGTAAAFRSRAEEGINNLSRRINELEERVSDEEEDILPEVGNSAREKIRESREFLQSARESLGEGSSQKTIRSTVRGIQEIEKARTNVRLGEKIFNGEDDLQHEDDSTVDRGF
ncbi:MAG: hypothetical protein AAB495_04380 [Patescibacteria group bacterium]